MKKVYFTVYLWAFCLLTFNLGFSEEQNIPPAKPEQGREFRHSPRESGMQREGGMSQDAMIGKMIENPKIVAELGLSEEQVKTLKAASEEIKKKHEEFEKQLKEAGLEQAKKMSVQGPVDEEAVIAAVERAGRINTEMAKTRARHMMLVKKTLTPEQTAKIREMVQRRLKQMRSEAEKKSGEGKESGEISKERREHIRKHFQENRKSDTNDVSVKPSVEPVKDLKNAE